LWNHGRGKDALEISHEIPRHRNTIYRWIEEWLFEEEQSSKRRA
jgi:hypothetical protein